MADPAEMLDDEFEVNCATDLCFQLLNSPALLSSCCPYENECSF